MTKEKYAIYAKDVYKNYKGGKPGAGLNGFDLEVKAGTIYGLLGPNGAGKTTAVRIFSTLLQYDKGDVRVAGYDVKKSAGIVREHIGLVGQYAAVDEILTGKQNLQLFSRLLGFSAQESKKRADELLKQFRLVDAQNTPASKYSGGMRRRLDLAASLITSPAVLFVDEPTTGLDPVARRDVWDAIEKLAAGGTTVLLTTQYLEEADQLADRIAVLKDGKVIAEGTPKDLKKQLGDSRIELSFHETSDMQKARTILTELFKGHKITVDETRRVIHTPAPDAVKTLAIVANHLASKNINVADIEFRQPTLDEVFIHLTGDQEGKNDA